MCQSKPHVSTQYVHCFYVADFYIVQPIQASTSATQDSYLMFERGALALLDPYPFSFQFKAELWLTLSPRTDYFHYEHALHFFFSWCAVTRVGVPRRFKFILFLYCQKRITFFISSTFLAVCHNFAVQTFVLYISLYLLHISLFLEQLFLILISSWFESNVEHIFDLSFLPQARFYTSARFTGGDIWFVWECCLCAT